MTEPVTIEVAEDALRGMHGRLQNALRPRVRFSSNHDEMKEEADEVTRKELMHVIGQLQFILEGHV